MRMSDFPTHSVSAPGAMWRQAVVKFATNRDLRVDNLLNGEMFTCGEIGFRLQYNAEVDPDGLVVLMELGEIPSHSALDVRLEMLSHNARRPSALLGYFGILPGTQKGAYCVRLDLKKSPEPELAIAVMIESLVGSIALSFSSMKDMIHALTGVHPDKMKPLKAVH